MMMLCSAPFFLWLQRSHRIATAMGRKAIQSPWTPLCASLWSPWPLRDSFIFTSPLWALPNASASWPAQISFGSFGVRFIDAKLLFRPGYSASSPPPTSPAVTCPWSPACGACSLRSQRGRGAGPRHAAQKCSQDSAVWILPHFEYHPTRLQRCLVTLSSRSSTLYGQCAGG